MIFSISQIAEHEGKYVEAETWQEALTKYLKDLTMFEGSLNDGEEDYFYIFSGGKAVAIKVKVTMSYAFTPVKMDEAKAACRPIGEYIDDASRYIPY